MSARVRYGAPARRVRILAAGPIPKRRKKKDQRCCEQSLAILLSTANNRDPPASPLTAPYPGCLLLAQSGPGCAVSLFPSFSDKRTCSTQGGYAKVVRPRLHCGCSFLPRPKFTGFDWSAPEFRFAGADYPERALHSRLLE